MFLVFSLNFPSVSWFVLFFYPLCKFSRVLGVISRVFLGYFYFIDVLLIFVMGELLRQRAHKFGFGVASLVKRALVSRNSDDAFHAVSSLTKRPSGDRFRCLLSR